MNENQSPTKESELLTPNNQPQMLSQSRVDKKSRFTAGGAPLPPSREGIRIIHIN
jgi:hypothetical protein